MQNDGGGIRFQVVGNGRRITEAQAVVGQLQKTGLGKDIEFVQTEAELNGMIEDAKADDEMLKDVGEKETPTRYSGVDTMSSLQTASGS